MKIKNNFYEIKSIAMQKKHDLIPYRSIIPQKLKSQNQTTVLQN